MSNLSIGILVVVAAFTVLNLTLDFFAWRRKRALDRAIAEGWGQRVMRNLNAAERGRIEAEVAATYLRMGRDARHGS